MSQDNGDKVTRLVDFLRAGDFCEETVQELVPEHFEKDQDENSHIDFITAASVITLNLTID